MKPEDSDHSKHPEPKVVPLEVVDEIPKGGGRGDDPQKAEAGERHRPTGLGWRFVLSLIVAAVADGLEVLFPFAWVPIDLATVGIFFLLWGVRWEVALVLIPELIPGVNVFPSWVMLALYLGNAAPTPRGNGGQ